MKILKYKGYSGSIEYSQEDELLYGQVMGLNSLISYEGKTGKELEKDFTEAVDDYLLFCKEEGTKAEKPFTGNFNVRIPSELHQRASLLAMRENRSLNSFVANPLGKRSTGRNPPVSPGKPRKC